MLAAFRMPEPYSRTFGVTLAARSLTCPFAINLQLD
jgi:hypothetical protein